MSSSPAVAVFNKDVLSCVPCVRCGTDQEHKAPFSSDLLQHRRARGEMGCPELGLQGAVAAGAHPKSFGL